jgi:hypothetical protein
MGGIAPHRPLTYALHGGPRDLAVTDRGRVVGMLWRHELLHELRGGGSRLTVADVMDADVVTADVDESVYDVQLRMNRLNRWAIPVIEDGQYRGIFTADRFVHLYHQLAPFPQTARRLTDVTAAFRQSVRAWTRWLCSFIVVPRVTARGRIQQNQFVERYLRTVLACTTVIHPTARFKTTFEVDPRPRAQIFAGNFGHALPRHNAEPLRVLLEVAVGVVPPSIHGDPKRGAGGALIRIVQFWVGTQASQQAHLV